MLLGRSILGGLILGGSLFGSVGVAFIFG